LFVGATTTVIRAAVLGTILVLGQRLERRAHAWTTLFAACGAMTLWDPQTLWDLGFQLSALATASLFAYGKGVERRLLPPHCAWAAAEVLCDRGRWMAVECQLTTDCD
jgi:competence protein ComEC